MKLNVSTGKPQVETVSSESTLADDGMGVAAPAPCALLFNLETTTPKGAALHELFVAMGLAPRDVARDELDLSVGYLAGLPGFSAGQRVAAADLAGDPAASVSTDEFVLFCHLPDDKVMGVIRTMKAAGLAVGCKATLTEFNRAWSFGKLVREVSEEHAAIERFRAQKRAEQGGAGQGPVE